MTGWPSTTVDRPFLFSASRHRPQPSACWRATRTSGRRPIGAVWLAHVDRLERLPARVLRNHRRCGIAETDRKGGCSHASARDPVNIPHDNENRGEATRIDGELNPHVIGPFRMRRWSRNRLGSTSQGGDTGSNPVGTTQVIGHIRVSHERVAPHWPRGVHEAVTARCSVTRPKKQVDST